MKQPKVVKVKPVGSVKSNVVKTLINIGITLVFGLVYFYFALPALNFQSEGFYVFLFLLSGVYCVTAIVTSGIWRLHDKQEEFLKSVKTNCKVPLLICAALLLLLLVGGLLSSILFRARAYSSLLPVGTGDFSADVAEISYDRIPMLDSASAQKLGDRKLGELSDMVSQFEVESNYTQINYKDRPVRVTPLFYGDFIKWLNNRGEGLPAYIMIDMVTQNVEVVRLPEGMKYTTSEYFFRNLNRHLRFQYPTFLFDTPAFEIDDSGAPYWVCPRVVKTIGLFGGKDIKGVVLVNAVTGESEYCVEIPTWVDRAYSADMIMQQYDYYGEYSNGYLNSVFGQKGVTVTTDGYNYIAMDDDVYMYTGVTSVGGDESNVGFILSNLRTKETTYYEVAGADEYSAMSSAEGIVQHLGYTSTFPLLLNLDGEPTYFMALKDSAGLVKMYAMVNVRQYQLVATGTTVSQCETNYVKLLAENHVTEEEIVHGTEITGVVTDIRSAVIDGNTYFYFRLDNSENYFAVSAAQHEIAVTINVGDMLRLSYLPQEDSDILTVTSLEVVTRASETPALPPDN